MVLAAGLVVVAASAAGVELAQRLSSASTSAPSISPATVAIVPPASSPSTAAGRPGALPGDPRGELSAAPGALPRGQRDAIGVADGVLANHTTPFDVGLPGVARLDPALRAALQRAATDAKRAGVRLEVTSGWRSSNYQAQLFRQAVAEYGSAAEAARWVAAPGTSTHESGNAVDIGPADADAWLANHGAGYGLCQIYENEPWHFELRPDAVDRGCPPTYADPTLDPRMQQ